MTATVIYDPQLDTVVATCKGSYDLTTMSLTADRSRLLCRKSRLSKDVSELQGEAGAREQKRAVARGSLVRPTRAAPGDQ